MGRTVVHLDPQTDRFNTEHTTTRLNCVGKMLQSSSEIKRDEYAVQLANQAKRERWVEMSREIKETVEKYREEAARRRGDQRFNDDERLEKF